MIFDVSANTLASWRAILSVNRSYWRNGFNIFILLRCYAA